MWYITYVQSPIVHTLHGMEGFVLTFGRATNGQLSLVEVGMHDVQNQIEN